MSSGQETPVRGIDTTARCVGGVEWWTIPSGARTRCPQLADGIPRWEPHGVLTSLRADDRAVSWQAADLGQ